MKKKYSVTGRLFSVYQTFFNLLFFFNLFHYFIIKLCVYITNKHVIGITKLKLNMSIFNIITDTFSMK